MVIGVDVNHAKPGSVQNSFAAVVATLDKDATKFHTEVRVRPFRPGPLLLGTRDEYLTGRPMPYDSIHSMCADLGARSSSRAARANWRGHENALPCMAATQQNRSYVRPIRAHLPATSHGCRHKRIRVFFYRDGVAHSQFDTFAIPEIQDLKKSFIDLGINPELVYKVVQKRTRTRFAESKGERRFGNVPVGLVVDREVTDKVNDPTSTQYMNFYMVPHYGLKGTPKPAHYHVLLNEAHLSIDDLQALTFQLCHAYQRATKVRRRRPQQSSAGRDCPST
eukprot:scaffold128619_cov28-Tisochrysis_lutea.AAC.1